ncbi:1-deoxy-D-xylulose 5-phosphate reductoisomerase [Acetitomaculum ruminis DSM 5522]|uniref:1-deoxy-D-xylulose 5-phosphate reductoisomerase n=1 Tax=Acetitomaculum ruminis DSM 5522 TaxID=1120918 RepID=A0A1I1A7B2_9FIRM|nr:1-deoxy-D-xylulose-5-phosphate reductoisomerase [Acetitomaculum ruminis]SFB33879.1 1-deoxy-D-xylulose 5-phosphate reductoisomerase [Acetitomaculum ruminis DSM 5522]
MKNIVILGSTGSIGTQALEIIEEKNDLAAYALAANKNIKLLEEQCRKFKPKKVCVYDSESAKKFKENIKDLSIEVLSGMDGLIELATMKNSDIVLGAMVGMIGIRPTIAAIKSKKTIALANKETLVCAGHIIMDLAKKEGVDILPVDSEHSAIFQSLNGENHDTVSKILLTASGGPFRGKSIEELRNIKPEDALKHPNWNMGRKITIDSSTLVNKGLEVIEAKWLFDVDAKNIQVVVQPQSIIHSMVEYCDGAVIAQLGVPDMKLPIQYAFTWPKRKPMYNNKLDFWELKNITFDKPDMETFYGLRLAYDAIEKGGNLPTVYNAANELAVAKFLENKIDYLQIPEIIDYSMKNCSFLESPSIEKILETEREVYELIESRW